jgi:hypothetical protein
MDEQNQNAVELQVGAANGNFATLEQARDYLRQTRPQRADDTPVRIVVHAGDYPLTHGFTLSQQDSGSAAAPTTYCAASAGTVRLLGGRKLDGFTAVEDREVLARLPTAAQANVVQIDLKRLAIEDFGHFSARGFSRPITPAHMELFFADKRMSVARWPASEWTHIDRPAAVGDDEHGGELGNLEEGFYFADKRPAKS